MLHAYTACLLLLVGGLAGLGLYARLSGAALRAGLEQQYAMLSHEVRLRGQSGRRLGGATTGSAGWIQRREAALRTQEERPGTADPTGRPWPVLQRLPKLPFTLRLTTRRSSASRAG